MMRLLPSGTLLLIVGLGVGGTTPSIAADPEGTSVTESEARSVTKSDLEYSEAGTVTGTVRFVGAPPPAQPVDMGGDDFCLAAHGGTPPSVAPVRSSSSGSLAEVIVYIRAGLGGQASDPSSQEIVLDQEGCMYGPRVLAVQAGQTLVIRNSDATLHNVHVSPPAGRGFNIGQPLRGLESRRVFEEPEGLVPVKCDIHGWMHATILVLDHPFFAVTTEDGRFSLDGLPPGQYVLEAWHETLGTRTQSVTVREDQQTSVDFSFES